MVKEIFRGASDNEVARISYQCRIADPAIFDSSQKALRAYGCTPGPKPPKTAKEVMAERLLKCWRENGGDKGKEGVDGLKAWMFSNPTENVSRYQSHQNGAVAFSPWFWSVRECIGSCIDAHLIIGEMVADILGRPGCHVEGVRSLTLDVTARTL